MAVMFPPQRIRVLVVEDSPVVQAVLVKLLTDDPHFEVVGTANNGLEAVAFVARAKPDVVLMDVHMPKLDGIEATRQIMEQHPVPIVITSATIQAHEVPLAFRAMQAGALAFVDKSAQVGTPQFAEQSHQLKEMLRLMSEVKVVRRRNRGTPSGSAVDPSAGSAGERAAVVPPAPSRSFKLVAIGASTGGPPVLQIILSQLPSGFALPLLIVQHITPGFVSGLADWLAQTSRVPTHLAVHGAVPLAGHAYLAPDDCHLGLDASGRISLSKAERENGLRPAVSHLFRSVADTVGAQAIGVLLTGMGKDGAAELKLLKLRGAVTIAQDRASCVVNGMPGEAVLLGAADYILPPAQIPLFLTSLASRP
ncbi:MAG: chemotaxis-specific protein-glutamate methyltransferase CheB [Pirellulaceae bacterium]|nr:chemotaxis-specific protein-glutamate methyltransferase CheB [Pirellulaceae bacterium]